MAMNKAQIMTLALRYLGIVGEKVEDPDDEDNPRAVIFSDWWDAYLPKELEQHDWQFARASELLTASGTYTSSPYPGLPYIYIWPPHCLAPRFIIPQDGSRASVPMRIGTQGTPASRVKLIYTSLSPAELMFTADLVKDEQIFSYSFGMMFAARMALEHATLKFGDGKVLAGIQKLYAALQIEAKNADLMTIVEDDWRALHTSSYITARNEGAAGGVPSTFTLPE